MSSSRPVLLRWFEVLVVVAVVLRLAGMYLNRTVELAAMANIDASTSAGAGMSLRVAGALAPLALATFASRRASIAAKWMFVIWVVLLAGAFAAQLALGRIAGGPNTTISISIVVLYALAVATLFQRDVRRWFRGERSADDIAEDFS